MTNADKFKEIFGIYATELWAKSEEEFLAWLNADVPDTNVGDTISRQAAIEALECEKVYMSGFKSDGTIIHPFDKYNRGLEDGKDALKALPSAQPERKEGRWIVVSDGYGNGEATACISECSECKDTIWVYKKADRKWNYCPNCGAKMGGEEDERTD